MNSNDPIMSRREFCRRFGSAAAGAVFLPAVLKAGNVSEPFPAQQLISVARNGSPAQNLDKVLELQGGIDRFVGPEDIVIIKPNCQWRNQGTTNIACVRRLIERILDIDGFQGEIIVAENIHRSPSNSEGWTVENAINFDTELSLKNYNQLIDYFQDRGHENVTKYHVKSTDRGGTVVTGPEDGDGYVHTALVYTSVTGDRTIMTYPVFTSAYSGITIDFKNGAWKNGSYLQRNITFINTSVLNEHGSVNATCSVKNLMGIVDLPGNETGLLPGGYKNFHSILTRGMGGALGMFMNTIRKPDLNIITAEWVGWGSRIDPALAAHARTVLSGTDPVSLDYWATKYVLYPHTPDDYEEKEYHHPDHDYTHLWKYLHTCHDEGIGTLDESEMQVAEYDFASAVTSQSCRYRTGDVTIYYNYPNPFNSETSMRFDLHAPASVSAVIYNSYGRQVRTLLPEQLLPAGTRTLVWNGRDRRFRPVPGGLYICRFSVNKKQFFIKIIASK